MHQRHFGQSALLFEVVEFDHPGKGLLMGDLQCAPRVFLDAGLGVEVMTFRVQGRRVRISGLDDSAYSGNPWLGATGVVEKEQVTHRHGSHEIARLIVAHTVPASFAELLQILDRKFVRLGFHQPISHLLYSRNML